VLTLAAPIVEVDTLQQKDAFGRFDIQYNGLKASCMRDILDDIRKERIFCLLIAQALCEDQPIIAGIILRSCGNGSQMYERVGSMVAKTSRFIRKGVLEREGDFQVETLHPDLWLGDVEDSIVTIV
jgi:hypothetical protein